MRTLVLPAVVIAGVILIGCSSASDSGAIPTYNMGDRAQAGPIVYTVFQNDWMPQLGAGPSARIPAHRFFLLRLSIVNGGTTDAMVPALTLVDDDGQRYSELSDGEGVPQWVGYIRRVKSADTLTGNVVFDVPAAHYKLEVADETEQKKAMIDIPLSFNNAEAPLPAPATSDTPLPTQVTPKK